VGVIADEPYQVWWSLVVGEHEVRAEGVRQDGELVVSEVVRFEVGE
jgi:hypothetical protein